MAALERLVVDQLGVAEILHSEEFAHAVRQLADRVADVARAEGYRVESGEPLPVEVLDDPGSDRAGATVAVRHPAGVGMEAHHGVLTRAAGEVGLSVEGLHAEDTG